MHKAKINQPVLLCFPKFTTTCSFFRQFALISQSTELSIILSWKTFQLFASKNSFNTSGKVILLLHMKRDIRSFCNISEKNWVNSLLFVLAWKKYCRNTYWKNKHAEKHSSFFLVRDPCSKTRIIGLGYTFIYIEKYTIYRGWEWLSQSL